MRIRSLVAWVPRGASSRSEPTPTPLTEWGGGWRTWSSGPLTVWYHPRSLDPSPAATTGLPPEMVLGDDREFEPGRPDVNLAGGVPVGWDPATRRLRARTSIVALPPLFLYRGARATALTSDPHLLNGLPGIALEFDPAGVSELGRFGHPVEHRTLFRDLQLLPGGWLVELDETGGTAVRRTWELPARDPLPWREFVAMQVEGFEAAVRRSDVSGSFLSLTAGLDTRTVFASLAHHGRLVPGVTLTGPRLSLDARTAARLCRAYGVAHEPVVIGDAFIRDLPGLVEESNRWSGGVSSLGQAPEVFLYHALRGRYQARLSGNLGNQVGRGGTEGVSLRGADLGILAPALRLTGDGAHWLLSALHRDDHAQTEFILQREMAFASAGNYGVGNRFAAQQSPYADRTLIEALARRPSRDDHEAAPSILKMRLRDLSHRFLGEPERASFQRALVKRFDGPAARIPVNWGWCPQGGVSPAGLIMGTATLVGMVARATGLDDGLLRLPLRWSGLPALHDFRESRRWLRHGLREFTLDILRSRAVEERDLFDRHRLATVLVEHFEGRGDHYETVTFALEIALADRIFCRLP